MIRIANKWISVFLILALCQGTQALKPEMSPGDPEIYINEGESLELTCNSADEIEFFYPKNSSFVNTSLVGFEVQSFGDTQGILLRRPNTVYGDTGWYGCTQASVGRNNDDSNVNWKYVYVKSNSSYFVENVVERPYQMFLGQTITIPCRPTSPNYKVNVTAGGAEIAMGSSASYDPRFGLLLKNLTTKYNGYIVCSITNNETTQEVKYSLQVIDPNVQYINLTSDGSDQLYEKYVYDHVEWVVYVDAYPPPRLKWMHPDGFMIRGSWINRNNSKYVTTISPTYASLRINNLGIADTGNYILHASNGNQSKAIEFRLKVLAKPIMKLQSLSPLYMLHHNVKISGEVKAVPQPNITCEFLEQPTYPDIENKRLVTLKVYDNIRNPATITSEMTFRRMLEASRLLSIGVITFITTYNASESGLLTCTACNAIGCDRESDLLHVSDLPLGSDFIAFGPKTRMMVGDDIKITCATSVYSYESVEWIDEDGDPLLENQQVSMSNEVTRFSNRKHLHIKKVERGKNGTSYGCRALSITGSWKLVQYKLLIYDPEKPNIWSTNMKKSPIILDLSRDKNKTILFSCHARGPPFPTITWYKDNTRIECGKRYTCEDHNQMLSIKDLLVEDSGNYTCKAENDLGKDYKYQIVVIKGKETSIVLIISIVVLVVIFVVVITGFSIRVHRDRVKRKELMEAGLTLFMEGALESLNPNLTVEEQAELLPYQQKWEFPRERLDIGKQLGSGAFGIVVKAKAWGICDDESVTTVAVKKVKDGTDSASIRALATELKIMVHLGKHLNVVNLLGACTKNIPKCELLVIVEYCRFGNLQMYLIKHRTDFINQIDPESGTLDLKIGVDKLNKTMSPGSGIRANSSDSIPGAETMSFTIDANYPDGYIIRNNLNEPDLQTIYTGDCKDKNLKPICTQDLLSWAFQVARGMEYLSQRRVLHGDLAARNILLAENNVVKICDFGLAKTMYKDDNYKKKTNTPLPVKWMAIESIRDRIFSTQSDVWSFGIVLWEFFTLAETPYHGMVVEKQYKKLLHGYRLEQPKYAPKVVYDIMLQCWNGDPTSRPTFTNLVRSIGDLLEESVKNYYMDMNAPYMDMNIKALKSEETDYLTMMSAPDYGAITSPTSQCVNPPSQSPCGAQENASLSMSQSLCGAQEDASLPKSLSPCGAQENASLPKSQSPCDAQEDASLPKSQSPSGAQEGASLPMSQSPCGAQENASLLMSQSLCSDQEDASLPKSQSPCGAQEGASLPKSQSPCGDQEDASLSMSQSPCGAQEDASLSMSHSPCGAQEDACLPQSLSPCGAQENAALPKSQSPWDAQEDASLPKSQSPSGVQEGASLPKSQSPSGVQEGASLPKSQSPCGAQEDASLPKSQPPCGAQEDASLPMTQSPRDAQEDASLPKSLSPCGVQEDASLPKSQSPCDAQEDASLPMSQSPCGAQEDASLPKSQSPCGVQEDASLPKSRSPFGAQEDASLAKSQSPCGAQEDASLPKRQSPCGAQEDASLPMSPLSHKSESAVFNVGIKSGSKFAVPINETKANVYTDSQSETIEFPNMLTQVEGNNPKPKNVDVRRAEFARQRLVSKADSKIEKENWSDSGFCDTPQNDDSFDVDETDDSESKVDEIAIITEETVSTNIAKINSDYQATRSGNRRQHKSNNVDVPKQKINLRTNRPICFSNPNYAS